MWFPWSRKHKLTNNLNGRIRMMMDAAVDAFLDQVASLDHLLPLSDL
jgi:hypothetical protein